MIVYVQGRGKVTLSETQDFVAEGGQATVYRKKSVAYKVYLKPSSMIPVSKISELSAITSDRVIRPLNILLDSNDNPIGYTMQFLDDTVSCCKLFAKGFCDQNHISGDQKIKLVRDMQKTVKHIHGQNILIVDLNELNLLVNNNFSKVFFIDVDSYQTKNHTAPALMTNIRDWQAKQFSQLSDWFSFAVVTFNLFIGIHPFKGRHPDFKWPMNEDALIERMKQNVSVFDPRIQLPGTCAPLIVIPDIYRQWYKAVFVDGKRLPPPAELQDGVVITQVVQRITGSDNFIIKELHTIYREVIQYYASEGQTAILGNGAIYQHDKRLCDVKGQVFIAHTRKFPQIILGSIEQGRLRLHNASKDTPITTAMNVEQMMAYGGRLYAKMGATIQEITFHESPTNTIPLSTQAAIVHEHATKMFDGVIVQGLFRKCFISIFPKAGQHHLIQIKEIKGQIIDAKYDNNVLMMITAIGGKYNRHVIRFSFDHNSYDFQTIKDISYTGLNFVVLDNGVCCHMNENEEIELFRNNKDDTTMKVVKDTSIRGDIRLFKDGNNVIFARHDTVYNLKLK